MFQWMKSSMFLFCLLVGLTISLLSGCAHTHVFAQTDGTFLMIASSDTEARAYSAAQKKSQEHCEDLGKRFLMVSQRSSYQGMEKNTKAIINTFGVVAERPDVYGATSSTDDYKVEMTFKCL